MPGASYAKPDDQKINRVPPRHGWIDLPSKREGNPPALPEWRIWMPSTLEWWAELWSSPQATQWDQSGKTLRALACLYDDLIAGRAEAAKVSAEMRQHEDRHGLNPKAMLQLLWRIADEEVATTNKTTKPPKSSSAARRSKLRVV